ncbi:hypothetical protein GOODEAATRI_005706, partial [Goodea atripinnis]
VRLFSCEKKPGKSNLESKETPYRMCLAGISTQNLLAGSVFVSPNAPDDPTHMSTHAVVGPQLPALSEEAGRPRAV